MLDAVGKHCGAFTSAWMHSRSSTSESSNMQDYVAPAEIDARRCSAAGTKWLDNDADGVRDPGDLGLAGFRIYADLDGDGAYEDGEPFAISDDRGDWVIDGIKSQGEYTLREEPTRRGAAPRALDVLAPGAGRARGRSTPPRSPTRATATSATGARRTSR